MRRLLLVGTDTDVGKTTVAAGLCAAVAQRDGVAIACKPVETGFSGRSDLDEVTRLAGVAVRVVYGRRFALAAAPTAAARAAGLAAPRVAEIAALVRDAERGGAGAPDLVVVEGCGGALTPLNGEEYGIDVAGALPDYDFLLVAALKLGVLSHTFAIAEYARYRGIPAPRVVLAERFEPAPAWYRAATINDLSRRGLRVAAIVPHMPAIDRSMLTAAVAPLL